MKTKFKFNIGKIIAPDKNIQINDIIIETEVEYSIAEAHGIYDIAKKAINELPDMLAETMRKSFKYQAECDELDRKYYESKLEKIQSSDDIIKIVDKILKGFK